MGIGRHIGMKNMLPSNFGECLIVQPQNLMWKIC